MKTETSLKEIIILILLIILAYSIMQGNDNTNECNKNGAFKVSNCNETSI